MKSERNNLTSRNDSAFILKVPRERIHGELTEIALPEAVGNCLITALAAGRNYFSWNRTDPSKIWKLNLPRCSLDWKSFPPIRTAPPMPPARQPWVYSTFPDSVSKSKITLPRSQRCSIPLHRNYLPQRERNVASEAIFCPAKWELDVPPIVTNFDFTFRAICISWQLTGTRNPRAENRNCNFIRIRYWSYNLRLLFYFIGDALCSVEEFDSF